MTWHSLNPCTLRHKGLGWLCFVTMKTIPLTKGKVALVDDEDYERLSQMKWYALDNKHTWYAARSRRAHGNRQSILMHCLICDTVHDVDHIDGNGLNNVRRNLRPATRSQNMANGKSRGGTSKYKGVSWVKSRNVWVAYIEKDGKSMNLGYSSNEEDCAILYNVAAQLFFGCYARLNPL
jgi:hypothetical protein